MTSDAAAGAPERIEAVLALEGEFSELFARARRVYLDGAERVSPGLSPGAYKALGLIATRGPATASSLAERLLADKSQVSRLVRELLEHALIERAPDPHDGRSHLLSITAFGQERLRAARQHDDERLMRMLNEWTLDDIRTFTRLLRALGRGVTPDAVVEPDAGPSA